MITFGSVCSGIESASVAWHPLGFRAAWLAEIDPFCCELLHHHYGASRPKYMPLPELAKDAEEKQVREAAIKAVSRIPAHGKLTNFGDITQVRDGEMDHVDVLVGGTPCQDLSVAGKRAGLAGARSGLFHDFMRIARNVRPDWIVFENVPGLISSNNGMDFECVLDNFEDAGYVLDVDILDAQFFGLAQRRERVFVVCQAVSHLLNQKTLSSALTIAQCAQEMSLCILAEASGLCTIAQADWACAGKAVFSLQKRMRLFGQQATPQASELLNYLAGIRAQSGCGPENSALNHGASTEAGINRGRATPLLIERCQTEDDPWSTERSWRKVWEDLCCLASASITSTSSGPTAESGIYSCALMSLRIAKLIVQSMDSSPVFWTAASSSLIALREFTKYAEQASSSLFAEPDWVQPWVDFLGEARGVGQSMASFRVRPDTSQVLPLSGCMSGYSAPRREAGQGTTGTLGARTSGGGGFGTDFDLGGGYSLAPPLTASGRGVERAGESRGQDCVIPVRSYGISPDCFDRSGEAASGTAGDRSGLGVQEELAYALRAKRPGGVAVELSNGDISHCLNAGGMGRIDYETETLVTHALRADGFDASEDGTGRGTPLIPVAIPILEAGARTGKSTTDVRAGMGVGENGDPMFTLQGGKQHAVATSFRTSANYGAYKTGDRIDALTTGTDQTAHVIATLRGHSDYGDGLPCLRSKGGDCAGGSEVLIAFSCKDHGADAGDVSPTLRAMEFDKSHANGGGQVAIAFRAAGQEGFTPSEVSPPVANSDGGRSGVPTVMTFEQRIGRNGRGGLEEVVPPLKAESGQTGKGDSAPCAIIQSATGWAVRRLTPIETARLQGFPDFKKSSTITICKTIHSLGRQNPHAHAEKQCLTGLFSACSVVDHSPEPYPDVKSARQSSHTSKESAAKPADVSVLIHFGRQEVEIRSAEKSILLVKIAETKNWFHLSTQSVDFAQLIALTLSWSARITAGGPALPRLTWDSSTHKNGATVVIESGEETVLLAGDVEQSIIAASLGDTTSITSEVGGNSQSYDSILKTLCCCVLRAIGSFIPEGIRVENSFALKLTTISDTYCHIPRKPRKIDPEEAAHYLSHGIDCWHTVDQWWTKAAADGPIYKAHGNSMATNVMSWLGTRIKATM